MSWKSPAPFKVDSEGDAKLTSALANLSLTFTQLLQGNARQDMEKITSRSDKTSAEMIEDLKKLVISKQEDCKLSSGN